MLTHLNSGEVRTILTTCHTTVGSVGNEQHELTDIGKTGRSHWVRKRLTVHGSVMNFDDHLHGGDEGKTPIGRKVPVSPWGQPAIGYEARNKKVKSDKPIVRCCTK